MKNKKKRKKIKKRNNLNQEVEVKKNLIRIKKINLIIIPIEVNHKIRIINANIALIIKIKKKNIMFHLDPDQKAKKKICII